LEPLARNTAPAIALAALHLATIDPITIILVLAADHHIVNLEIFHQAIEIAHQKVIKDDSLVNFGITPKCPHEGYGYIKQG
ncbi:sugar phosphate nucleotidyltransferase, partial [Francisella tularensis subsp. holarctica]|uniref:sugar phosphate nucleotidyltransferase n=1 Tax=Francisella tularensis TaxID=263 RepID=UPI002381BD43